jgi:hypothetical protein
MSFKVGVLESTQRETDQPARKVNRSVARYLIRKQLARPVNKFLIQMLKQAAAPTHEIISVFWDGPLGVGNALPFSKPNNYGDKLHYQMPMAGDTGLRRHGLYRRANEYGVLELHTHGISVSGRSQFRFASA